MAANPPGVPPQDAALERAKWQAVVFAERPRRLELLKLAAVWPTRPMRLRVHRNQPFEFVASVLAPFLAYAGFSLEVTLSDYDDSLGAPVSGSAAVELVWLDFARYPTLAPREVASWLDDRLARLRAASSAPILVADDDAGDERAAEINRELHRLEAGGALHVVARSEVARELGVAYWDARASGATGMKLSDRACIELARRLGLRWLPPVLVPRIKAIAVDLDRTLYDGVLGEDGVAGLSLDDGHRALQRALVGLQQEGVLLAVVSRNVLADVEALFAARSDFPLRRSHLSSLAVGWGSKVDAIRTVAAELNIGVDAVLFVDDNAGELAAVSGGLPSVRTVHAASADETRRAIDMYPALHGYPRTDADAIRATDIAASRERQEMANAAVDPAQYLRSLEVELGFALGPKHLVTRLHEMSGKTNQFNTALARLDEAGVRARLDSPDHRVVAIRLRDRLSDSGVIASLFARVDGSRLVVEELCISCRALGRSLEDIMVTEALRRIAEGLAIPIREVEFVFHEGPRNAPAKEWLARYATRVEGHLILPWPARDRLDELRASPVRIAWESNDA